MTKLSNAVLRSVRKSKVSEEHVELLMTVKDQFGNTKFIEVSISQKMMDQLNGQALNVRSSSPRDL